MKNRLFFLFLYFFLFLSLDCYASSDVSILGDYLVRTPNSSRYIKKEFTFIPDNLIIMVPNNLKTSGDTVLNIKEHKVKLYPGCVLKICKGCIYPMLGRLEFNTDKNDTEYSKAINIVANNCNASYNYGHFMIESTPDNGIFFALKNNGSAWIKDISRKIVELKQGQQVQVPLFGNSIVKNRVESFWGKAPSSYGKLGEVGQETAYGIVGRDSSSSIEKQDKTKEKEDNEEDEKEEDDEEKDVEDDVEKDE